MNPVVQILDTIAEESARADRSDGQLLDLFVRLRDEEAFAAVVRRHGPMVLGVCRRILRNPADVDDAFQAAFLVLARKAATIGTRELLAPWLYGVASNTARKLRESNARRAVRERPLAETSDPSASAPAERGELLAILDDELARLPDRYRAVIVLCDLEGLTRREAAKRLACPEGTVAGRLARARDLLGARLTARGVAPAVGVLVAVLTESASLAVSPLALTVVVRAVSVDGLARAAATGLISPRVAETTEGVLKNMFATKLRFSAVAVMCCGLALACIGGAIHLANAQPTPDKPLVGPNDGAKPTAETPPAKPAPDKGVKVLTVIPLKTLEAKPTAEKLQELLPKTITVAAARDENTLIVYATAKGTEDVRLVLRTLREKLPKEAAKPAESKKYTFRMKNAKWDEVLDWYAKESGLTMITTVKPRGTFTVNPPAGREFTLAEITDLLNESLAQQKLILIRRHMTFFIHPADEKIDPTLIPRIELNELPKRGKSEIVQVILPLKTIKVSDIQDEVKKLLTPFGSLVVLEKQNALLIQDTAGNIFRIRAAIEVEHPTGPDDSLDHVCKWQSAQAMADVLKTLLTDKDTTVTVSGMPRTNPRARNVQIAVDARRNALVLTAPPDKLVLAKKIIAELDKPRTPSDKPFVPPEPILKTYNVPLGSAAEVAKKLTVAIAGRIQVVPLKNENQIMVLATPEDHERVAKLIPAKGSGKNPEPKSYAVKFQKTPWKDVFAWYATASGLTRVGDSLPSGTFTFVPPAPENPQEVFSPALSLDEVTDYINETLLTRKWLLVRGETTFAVIPADEKVDPKYTPYVELSELAKRRRTELVTVHIALPATVGLEVTTTVRKLTGPFGNAQWYPPANTLILRDTVGNVMNIRKVLADLVRPKPKE